jgi:hypothetical protein
MCFVNKLDESEAALADLGYNDHSYFITPKNLHCLTAAKHKLIMERHETVNHRFKQFEILHGTYRHSLSKHPTIFKAIANLVQLDINSGAELFAIHI